MLMLKVVAMVVASVRSGEIKFLPLDEHSGGVIPGATVGTDAPARSNISFVSIIAFGDLSDIMNVKNTGVTMSTMTTEPVLPSTRDTQIAKESSRKLAPLATEARATVQVHIGAAGKHGETVDLPTAAFQLLVRILTEMSQGNAVTLMPVHAQLTTQQAAELLGVSRPFIIKELKDGRIHYQMVGTHRRIAYSDLMAYKEKCRANHGQAMDELVQQAQSLKMGY